MKTHKQQILEYIKVYGTVTSQELRNVFHWADIRKPVSDLRKEGLVERAGTKKGSAVYRLVGTPIKQRKITYVGGTAKIEYV